MQVSLRVRPGASRTAVGGAYGDRLVVAVTARAVDGAATEAVLVAVAAAFGVRTRDVRLVRGRTARDKLVDVAADRPGEADRLTARLAELLAARAPRAVR